MKPSSEDRIYFRPVIPYLFSFSSGLVIGYFAAGKSGFAAPVAAFCALFGLYNIAANKTAVVSPLLLFCCLGYLSLQPWTAPQFSPNHIVHFADTIPRHITGRVLETPVNKNHRTYLYLNVSRLVVDENPVSAAGRLRLTIMGDGGDITKGDLISFVSRIRPIRNFHNPGGFDYERYMAFKKIWVSAYTREGGVKILESSQNTGFCHRIEKLRSNISNLIQTRATGDAVGILKALVTGDRTGITPQTRNAFNRLGLGHLLAISGLHVGIVATLAFFLFYRLFSLVPAFLARGAVKKVAALAAVFPVLFYGLISGMSPSTQRAVIMVIIFLAAFWMEREYDPLNTLAVAAFAILIYHPPALFSISFQLSFAAVTCIFLGIKIFPQRFSKRHTGDKNYSGRLLAFFWVSFLAILGTLPLVMHYFNLVSFAGLFANAFAIPLIGFLVVPLGLLSAFVYPFFTPVSALGFDLAAAVLAPAVDLISMMSGFPHVAVTTITPGIVEICCYYLITTGVLYFRKSRGMRIVLSAAILVLAADVSFWTHRRFFSTDFRVTAMDVGQGQAVLLEFPKGYTMMIDGGGFSDNSVFDVGERIIAPYLLKNKIRTVDTLVLTHPNADHLNGLIHIAENFNVTSLWTNGQEADTLGYKLLMDAADQHGIRVPDFRSLPRHQVIHGVDMDIIHPAGDFDPEKITRRLSGTNDNSIVLRANYGDASFLFPGDITADAEREIISTCPGKLKSDVLFSPHHGSKSSSTTAFLNRVKPASAVICAGWQNRFHFPHASVLKKYRARDIDIFRTDLSGAIQLLVSDGELAIKPTIIPDEK